MNGKTAFVTGASAGIVGTTGVAPSTQRVIYVSDLVSACDLAGAIAAHHRLLHAVGIDWHASEDIAAHRRRAGTADTGLRGILCKSFSNLFKKSTAGCVGDGRTDVGRTPRVEHIKNGRR